MTKKWYEELSREEHKQAVNKGAKTASIMLPALVTAPLPVKGFVAATGAVLGVNAYDMEKKKLQNDRNHRINSAAWTIQQHGQDYVRRREEKEWKQQNAGARKIQTHVRGYLARDAYAKNPSRIFNELKKQVGTHSDNMVSRVKAATDQGRSV